MNFRSAIRDAVVSAAAVVLAGACITQAQVDASQDREAQDADLKFVVVLSRHGVRSPTGKSAQYNKLSATPWPEWSVPPGYLTPHGYKLMTFFGAYDRALFSSEGLLAQPGCGDASHVSIFADSDQRTRETGKAIAEGLLPGCPVDVHALAEGAADPLFHYLETGQAHIDHALAAAAVRGRVGGNVDSVKEAYRPQLAELDDVLAGCGHIATNPARTSLFDIPAKLEPGTGDHPVEMRGPLNTASTLSEILLLEYTEGRPEGEVGWGCVKGTNLRGLMQLHTAAADLEQHTPAVARMYASNLLDKIVLSMEQSVTGKPVSGALGKPDDRVLLLVGHDTNIATVAGALGISWIIDGRRDDTPPGGALVFEVWRSKKSGANSVRTWYTAQTLEQMRTTQALTLAAPPARVPVYVPGCGSEEDLSCTWDDFDASLHRSIDPAYVSAPQ